MEETKRCPYCGEKILAVAIKCRYCSSILNDAQFSSGSLSGIDLVRQALGHRYDVLHEIGSGGMATVYKAIQRNLNRPVALKVIHQNLVHDQEFVKRFHREAQISASLQHPNIVTIYDVGESKGVHYMAMEYLEGTDLHRMITKTGRLGEKQSLGYLMSVSRALEYVHKRGLIHRDIKSSNIFICSDADASQAGMDADTEQRFGARVVLMDFGIAHAASGTRLTRAGAVIGRPEYMSPGQEEAKQVDHRTDIYSLGVVLYECLTGQVPFKTDSYITTIHKVIHEQPDASRLSHMDESLRHFTLILMSKEASNRPASASEVIEMTEKVFKDTSYNGQIELDSHLMKDKPIDEELIDGVATIADQDRDMQAISVATHISEDMGQTVSNLTKEKSSAQEQYFISYPFDYQMILIKGGTFIMGCTSDQGSDCWSFERPAHHVTLSSYYIGKFLITQKFWKQLMGNNPSHFINCDDCPVENVSWNDIQEFLQKLNHHTGMRFRLPTEAEWEYAGRGGNQSKRYKYAGSNNIDEVAWHLGNSHNKSQPVGMKNANELGIYDMSGNVWEWCHDWYGQYSKEPKTNPRGPFTGSHRVLRGGSWRITKGGCRLSYRISDLPSSCSNRHGFRISLSI